MAAKIEHGKLVITSNGKSDAEDLVNRQMAIIRSLQQISINKDDAATYFLLETLGDMVECEEAEMKNEK